MIKLKPLISLFLILSSTFSVVGQTNRALIVAIDKYPPSSGWAEIHATNDISLVRPMLGNKGFRDDNIVVLANEQATKAKIADALNGLANRSRRGDHIYIHFSCHGQQMADDNGDEPDGLDEALIPYDARRRFEQGVYEGENHLRDDELEVLLEVIRRKIGPKGDLTLVLDACHSGTADRDSDEDVYVRGTAYVFAPPGYVPQNNTEDDVVYDIKSASDLAPMTVIAACQPDQINYEYRDPGNTIYYGSLTYALCGIIEKANEIPYHTLHGELSRRIGEQSSKRRHIQTPLLETTDEKKAFRIGR